MKYLILILMIVGLCACAPGADKKGASAPAAAIVAAKPIYTFHVISNSNVAGDVYVDFGMASQTETGTGVISVPASQDFNFQGSNTLAQWKLISGPGFEVKLYKNGVLVDDQIVTTVGASVTMRSDI